MISRSPGIQFWTFWAIAYIATALVLVFLTHSQNPVGGIQGLTALTQGVFAGHDTLTHDYPAWMWGWNEIHRSGRIPLWNPSWFGGEAFIASQTFMVFYPANWIGGFLSTPIAFNVQYPLHLVLAGLVMAWTCKRRKIHPFAAGMAGLTWGFGSHLASLMGPGHLQKLQALAWRPLVVWGAGHIMRTSVRERRSWLPLATGLTMQITAGHLQIVYLSLIGGFLEGAASIGIHARHHVKPGGSLWRSLLHPVLRYLFASVMAFGLAAVFLLPTVEFAELSNRSVSLSWDDATSGSLVRDELLECVLPRLRGDSMLHGRGAYLPAGDRNSDSATERIVSDYVGATVLLFIIIGLLGPRWRVRFKVIGYTTLGLAGLAVSLGRNLPGLYRILYEYMPGIAHFRSPWTSAALLAFGFVMASTLGLDWLMRKQERERKWERKHAGQTLSVILLLSVFLIITLDVYWGFALPGYPGSVSIPETADSATRGLFLYHALRHLGLSLAGVMLVLAVLVCSMRGRQRTALIVRTACLGLLIFFTSWDLLGNHHVFWNTVRMEPYHRFLERHWAEDIWDREIGPVRVLQTDSVLSNRPLTLTNFDERRLISSVHGYHPVVYGDYFRLYQELGYLHPVFLRLFGVNYLVIPSGQRDVPDGYAPIMDTGSHTLYHHRGQEYVRPVRHISVVRNMDSVIRIMKDKTFDPYYSSLAMIGDAGDEFLGMGGEFPDMQLKYRVDSVAPGEIRLDLKTRSRGMVIISEPAVPGWRMRMEGHDTSAMLTRLDGYFLAFPVEPGSSRVELTYDPVSQRLGLYLTCLSLGFLTFLVIGSPRKSGRGKQVPTRTIPAYWRL